MHLLRGQAGDLHDRSARRERAGQDVDATFAVDRRIHGVHHQYPSDKDRLVMPITVSIPLAVLFGFLFVTFMGDKGWGFFCGFGAGYVFYDMMHYSVHHVQNSKSALFRKIRRHHMAHHFRDTRLGFGVSSYFWDRVFKT